MWILGFVGSGWGDTHEGRTAKAGCWGLAAIALFALAAIALWLLLVLKATGLTEGDRTAPGTTPTMETEEAR